MAYKKYGETFKKIRKQNGFTLLDFSSVGLAKSTLSDFERGSTMISLEKIDLALQLMGYSLSDFDNHLNFYSPTDTTHILKEIENAVLLKNTQKLKEIQNTCLQIDQKYIAISIKFLLEEGRIEEKEKIINYLYETKAFGIKELSIFYSVVSQLTPHDILNIMKRLRYYGKGMANSETYHHHLAHLILQVILVLSNYRLKEESYFFLQRFETLNLAQSMLLRNLFKMTKGLWEYNFDNKEIGIQKVEKGLEILHLGARPEVATFYQEKFGKLMTLNGSVLE
ncbi:helix-turn-helix domain-containing protein [Lactococcus garvieae]|uniref:Rgg/GadR/MutR family transcriptional regulator n=1 Tax=Lactococcus garvieae TaxID=1363 RepID=UPI0030CB0FBC